MKGEGLMLDKRFFTRKVQLRQYWWKKETDPMSIQLSEVLLTIHIKASNL